MQKQLSIYYKNVLVGDYILKCNKNSNGRLLKYFQMTTDNLLKWSPKEEHIDKEGKFQSYYLSDIRGVIYGKCTEVLCKSYNKKLQTFQCFSLIMRTRSMDFYCERDQINSWVIALSMEIKQYNPKAYTLSIGKFFWMKMRLILTYYYTDQIRKKDKNYRGTFK